jgi:hypothetical protein
VGGGGGDKKQKPEKKTPQNPPCLSSYKFSFETT